MVLDDEAKNRLRQIEANSRAIEEQSGTSERKPFRVDGYINLRIITQARAKPPIRY